jgi:hypothetical protein
MLAGVLCAFLSIATLIKTAVMIGVAFAAASMFGVSFGHLWTAVLKLGAMVVVTDAALYWLETFMISVGATPITIREIGAVIIVHVMAASFVIVIFLFFFFDMERSELGKLALVMAILSRILNLVIMLVLAVIVAGVAGALAASKRMSAPPPPPAATSPAPTSPSATTGPSNLGGMLASANDRRISRLIASSSPLLQEARDYYNTTLSKPRFREFVLGLYDKGARRVYIERGGGVGPAAVIVEMPENTAQRAALAKAIKDFVATEKIDAPPPLFSDNGNRFLEIPLPPPR